MSTEKKLTVVTINRNNTAGVRQTITSLGCLRDCPDIEFVFVDGGSSDGSVEVALEFYTSSEIICGPDRGIYHAMNKGLHRATGEFIVWINSGDEFSGDLQVLAHLHESCADVVAFDTVTIFPEDASRTYLYQASPQLLPRGTLSHSGTYFRRTLVERFGGYDERWKIVADRELIVRLLNSGASFDYISLVAARFRHGGICSTDKFYLETMQLHCKLGLISRLGYLGRFLKYMIFIRGRRIV